MDREQEEMQFLGLFGIYKESYKTIFTWRKIFSQITLTLILPLTFIFLAHLEVSHYIISNLLHDEIELQEAQSGTPRYNRLSDVVSSELVYFCLFKLLYFTFFFIFSLLSTAAVVYTVASIYASRDVTFKKVMSVVPKVWKRLMVTFLCIFVFLFAYNLAALLFLVFWAILFGNTAAAVPTICVFLAIYFVGLVYLTLVWQLASVVSVLEEDYGVGAMRKSRSLIKGKMLMAAFIFFTLALSTFVIQIVFERLVVDGWNLGTVNRIGYGVVCFLLLLMLFLFGLVIQTVLYFVCKSYHHENIDKSALSDHLKVYLVEYVPLKSKDVQLEHFDV